MITALIARDVRRAFTGAAWLPIVFFLLVATLVPFAIGPDARLLVRVGPGALWIAALTAALLPIERLVEPDRADGVLDQLALHGMAEESVALDEHLGSDDKTENAEPRHWVGWRTCWGGPYAC